MRTLIRWVASVAVVLILPCCIGCASFTAQPTTKATRDEKPFSDVAIAVCEGDRELVERLLHAGANPNDRSFGSGMPLIAVASINGHADIVRVLLFRYRVNPNAQDRTGTTPLSFGVLSNSNEVVSLLIQAGANLNLPNKNKDTSLHYVAIKGNVTIAKLLIAAGADANIESDEGRPSVVAECHGFGELAAFLREHEAN